MIKFLWERASFAAQTQSFLCGKFSTARLEVLPNLRHAGVFQMSSMVITSGLDWREDEHLLFDSARSLGIYKFQLAGKWSESEKISCHAILKNLYEPELDVTLTISFKIRAEIEITKHMFCVGFADEVYRLCEAYNYDVCSFIHSLPWNTFTLYFFLLTVNSFVYAAGSSLNGVCQRIFHWKGIKQNTFHQNDPISLSGVAVR